jgi:mycofactocin precursor
MPLAYERDGTRRRNPAKELLMSDPATQTIEPTDTAEAPDDDAVIEDVLVEEISIDGMCGVY